MVTSGRVVNNFRYTGREWDPETSLYYYRARYYDAGAGRFLSEDPIGFNGGVNFYAAVSNNPLYATDPFGTCLIVFYLEHTGPRADGHFYHTFLTITDGSSGSTNHMTYVFRGGPATNGARPPSLVVSATMNAQGVSVDSPQEAVYSEILLNNNCSCGPLEQTLESYERLLNQLKISYGYRHNSNSVTSDAIHLLGLKQPSIPWGVGPLMPGWGNSLLPSSPAGGGW